MLTRDQETALLMVIADLRIHLANADGEIAMLKGLIEQPKEADDGDSSRAPDVGS